MLKTVFELRDELKEYAYPDNKISRMVKDGMLYPVAKGLYETDETIPGYVLAGCIYGRSYLSFEYALAYYGLIPERVHSYTSATFRKKKSKSFENHYGRFTYRDIPAAAFPYGLSILNYGDYSFVIASPEKAVCDLLYAAKPLGSKRELNAFLFENMRIDINEFSALNMEKIHMLADYYHSTNLKLLLKLSEVQYE